MCAAGDIAYRLLDYIPHGEEDQSKNKLDITVVDVNGDMLQEGMSKRKDSEGIHLMVARLSTSFSF